MRRRGALILIAPVPEPSAVLDAATEMFEVDQDQSVRRHDDQVDLSVVTPLVGLPHHEIGKPLPLARKSKANVFETGLFGGLRAFRPEKLDVHGRLRAGAPDGSARGSERVSSMIARSTRFDGLSFAIHAFRAIAQIWIFGSLCY